MNDRIKVLCNKLYTQNCCMKLQIKTKPWPHQLKALKFLLRRVKRGETFGAIFTTMGSGKTKIMIDFVNTMWFGFTLIIAPKKASQLVWPKEIQKHSNNPYVMVLELSRYSSKEKVLKLDSWLKSDSKLQMKIAIINYDSVWREPFKSYLLKHPPECIICDELHRIKSPGSKCSRFLHLISKKVKYRYGMTGTPLGQSPLDIYAQYRFLNESIFGTRYDDFTDKYAHMINMGNYKMLDKSNPFKNLDELQEKMFSCAFVSDSEVELPPTNEVLIEYHLTPKLEAVYKELQKEGCLMLSNGEYVDTKNVLSLVTRLQQIVNGYLPVSNFDNQKVQVKEFDTYRVEVLQELLDGMPEFEKVVVFCKYTKDIKDVQNACSEIGRTWSEISGRANEYYEWNSDDDDLSEGEQPSSVLIVQIQAGAEGLDFTRARYCIYYDLHYSLTLYKQSRKRIHRPGQTRPVTYYTLMAKLSKGKSIDERIYESLQKNEDVIQSIMEAGEI